MKFLVSYTLIAVLFAETWACVFEGSNTPVSLPRRFMLTRRGPKHPFGSGNRFSVAGVVPQGLGLGGPVPSSILNHDEIESAMDALLISFPTLVTKFTTPYQSVGGASLHGWKIRKGENCDDAFPILMIAGIHPRERGGPDNLIYFISDLLHADAATTGLTYGGKSYTSTEVKMALEAGIVILPAVNPDVLKDNVENTRGCLNSRKNRNDVDLNRNFDFIFDLNKFAPGVSPASAGPTSEVYQGLNAFSEPETESIRWTMDKFKKLRWFMDIHSGSEEGLVLYNWGDDLNQWREPSMNFQNPAHHGKIGVIPDQAGLEYMEYLPEADYDEKVLAAHKMADAMVASTGRIYVAKQSVGLYPTCGTSDDYAYSRHIDNIDNSKIHGFTLEFGNVPGRHHGVPCEDVFYPDATTFEKNMLEVGAGLMEFILTASKIGLGEPVQCVDTPPCAEPCDLGPINQCGTRASCVRFQPGTNTPNKDKGFCFCQAGFKPAESVLQYRLTWAQDGGQSHRVVVNPGQDCLQVCNNPADWCSEVPIKDACA